MHTFISTLTHTLTQPDTRTQTQTRKRGQKCNYCLHNTNTHTNTHTHENSLKQGMNGEKTCKVSGEMEECLPAETHRAWKYEICTTLIINASVRRYGWDQTWTVWGIDCHFELKWTQEPGKAMYFGIGEKPDLYIPYKYSRGSNTYWIQPSWKGMPIDHK